MALRVNILAVLGFSALFFSSASHSFFSIGAVLLRHLS